ncbi:MAG TPA: response regulator [Candidatus Sulfotelmatobacter sp.]|nr:response regulator [Candidatus Sulfotelmatobacter sp.]
MDKRRRVLLLDTDPDTLITLQHALEEANIDATVTWDENEACQLIGTARFDLILVGDHPPELNGTAIINDLSLRGTCPPVLILRGALGEKDGEYFRQLGAIGAVPKRDPRAVVEQVTNALVPVQIEGKRNDGWQNRWPGMASRPVNPWTLRCSTNAPIPHAPQHFFAFATASCLWQM